MRLGKLKIYGIVCIEVPGCSTLVSQSRAFDLVRDGPWEQVRVNFWSLMDMYIHIAIAASAHHVRKFEARTLNRDSDACKQSHVAYPELNDNAFIHNNLRNIISY
ncbi:hypothetical protein PILCRDRAFT_530967 [Piloderma croceum F 1598]|uniref:Uncharacterized protein n=1 Tax=Piloderma croceum (strain F 1598) TaxID=765440 RepID=A0A0C3B2B4_PILCF|nr:hypothetical protein PILCRDRAFT_530967 [Piloderma croceum F 1598]